MFMPVTSVNEGDIEDVAAWAEQLGCLFLVDPRITESFDDDRDTDWLVPRREGFLRAVKATRAPASARESVPAPPKGWPCLETMIGIHVRADGEIWRCPALPVSFGSVEDGPIAEVWRESPRRRALVAAARQTPTACQGCRVAWACHRCPAHALVEQGSLEKPSRLDCLLAEARAHVGLAALAPRCDTPVRGPIVLRTRSEPEGSES